MKKVYSCLIVIVALFMILSLFGCSSVDEAIDEPEIIDEEILETEQENGDAFSEDFSEWQGWENYLGGIIEHSDEVFYNEGYSLKRTKNNDPNGGWKFLDQEVNRNYTFEGWLYRPSDYSDGSAERLSLLDNSFSGYGFRITDKHINIEKRLDGQLQEVITIAGEWNRPENEWYKFVFQSKDDDTFTLELYDTDGISLALVTSFPDTEFLGPFDRVVIQGGHDYYVDGLLVK